MGIVVLNYFKCFFQPNSFCDSIPWIGRLVCDSGREHGAGTPQDSCVSGDAAGTGGLSFLLEQPRQLFVLPSHSGSLKTVF